MYEDYTRQALPSRKYRELLGTALCVFNSNNQFVIENILRVDNVNNKWADLSGLTAGELALPVKNTITKVSNRKIAAQFDKIIKSRNRIIHSFQITKNDQQVLSTIDKNELQFIITEEYLLNFIVENEKLALLLHDFRGF